MRRSQKRRNFIVMFFIVLFFFFLSGYAGGDGTLPGYTGNIPVIPATDIPVSLEDNSFKEAGTGSAGSSNAGSSPSDQLCTITATVTRGGKIIPSGVTCISRGGTVLYSIIPDFGNFTSGVEVDGYPVGVVTEYAFTNVQSDHTIHAVFAPEEMYILTPVPSSGGSITPATSQMVLFGESVTFTIQADECHTISDVCIDYDNHLGPQESPFRYTFRDIEESHTIEPVFTATRYTITATAGKGGSISPSGHTSVQCGWSQSYYISPDPGFKTKDVRIDRESVGIIPSYTFVNVSSSHTIDADFTSDTPVYDFLLYLAPGWNCVSIPKQPVVEKNTLGKIFGGIKSGGHSMYMYDPIRKNWDIPQDTHQVAPLEAYWIYTTKAEDIPIKYAENQHVPSILLLPGWNLMGYTGSEPTEVRLYLSSLGDAWELILGYDASLQRYEEPIIRDQTNTFSDAWLLHAGQGYWILCEQGVHFFPPF